MALEVPGDGRKLGGLQIQAIGRGTSSSFGFVLESPGHASQELSAVERFRD